MPRFKRDYLAGSLLALFLRNGIGTANRFSDQLMHKIGRWVRVEELQQTLAQDPWKALCLFLVCALGVHGLVLWTLQSEVVIYGVLLRLLIFGTSVLGLIYPGGWKQIKSSSWILTWFKK